jgi:hypothetical protein
MGMETPKTLTPEEIAKMQNSRMLSDAELIKDGGGHDPEYGGLIAPTASQKESAQAEMSEDISAKYQQLKVENRKQAEEIESMKEQLKNMQERLGQIIDVALGDKKEFNSLEEFDAAVKNLPEGERRGLFIIPEELQKKIGGEDVYFFNESDAEKYLEKNQQ